MAKRKIDDSILFAIADAIRAKNGLDVLYHPSEMAPAILALNVNGSIELMNLTKSEKLSSGWQFKLMTNTYSSSSNTYPSSISGFESVNIPHDWSIHRDFDQSAVCGYEGGFLDGGDAWYIKDIVIPSDDAGKSFAVTFDGVYSTCEVYMNGTKVGENHYGYNAFSFDVTDYVNAGQSNRLAVFVRNRQPSSRWYSGSGIYRHVYFHTGEITDASIYDAYITTPDIATELTNGNSEIKTHFILYHKASANATAEIKIDIKDENGNTVTSKTFKDQTLSSDSEQHLELDIMVENPNLWAPMDGHWYTAEITTKIGSKTLKSGPFTFGYRAITWDKDGLYINNVKTFMKGVCLHHDLGLLGAEVNESAIDRQLKIMKDMGCNAIRITHNPASKEFVNIAMKHGFILFEEMFDCWSQRKKTYDFAQYWSDKEVVMKNTFERDKNNPAIIAWSLGNEVIREHAGNSSSVAALKSDAVSLTSYMKSLDAIRPVTYGEDVPTNSDAQVLMESFDLIGLNYGDVNEYNTIRSKFPNKCIYGSETTSALSTRGCYANDNNNLKYPSLDDMKVNWGDYASACLNRHMSELDYVAGMFVWTGFDYIGEPTSYNRWPAKSSYFGIVDLAGFPKDVYYLYQQEWSSKPMVHAFPVWRGKVGSNVDVYVYSNCERVELCVNGETKGSLTKVQQDSDKKYRKFTIPYEIGTAVINGYDATGTLVAQDYSFSQLANANSLKLTADKTQVNNQNNDSLIFVECDVVDSNSTIKSIAANNITFSCSGGEIIGTDAGDSASVEAMRSATKKAMAGKLLCMVKPYSSASQVVIRATADGLTSNELTVATGDSDIFVVKGAQTFMNAHMPTKYEYPEGDDLNTIGDVEEITYSNIDVSNATTNGTKFYVMQNGTIDWANSSLYADIDLGTLSIAKQNILSIGTDITAWEAGRTNYNLHIYAPINSTGAIFAILCHGAYQCVGQNLYSTSSPKMRIALSPNGLYCNGVKIADADGAGETTTTTGSTSADMIPLFFSNLTASTSTVNIGSQEGQTRSRSTINEIRKYDEALSAEQMIELTSTGEIASDDSGAGNDVDISYTLESPITLSGTTSTIDDKLFQSGVRNWGMLISFNRSIDSRGDIFSCGNFSITHEEGSINRIAVKVENNIIDTNYSLFTDDYCQLFITRNGNTYTVRRLDTDTERSMTAIATVSTNDVVLGSTSYDGTIDILKIWNTIPTIGEVRAVLPECTSFDIETSLDTYVDHTTVLPITNILPKASIGRLNTDITTTASDANVNVEVSNGIKITGRFEGTTIVTINCGSITKDITVNILAAVEYDDPTILFSIDSDKVFGQTVGSGVDYAGVDTGVKLLDSDKDFAVFVKFTGSASNSLQADKHALIHCMHESNPWPGMSYQEDGNPKLSAHWWKRAVNATDTVVNDATTAHSVAFVHAAGEQTVAFYEDGVLRENMTSLTAPTFNLDETCIIGAYQNSSGVLGRFWNGTIHNAKIYNVTKTADEITALHNS